MQQVVIDLPESFPFSTEIRVRITDINYGGHLGNDALLTLIHEARVRFLGAHGLSERDVGGCGLIMTDAAILFAAEARAGDVLTVEVAIGEARLSRFDLLYRVTRAADGTTVARVKTGMACYDYERGRVARMPKALRDLCS